MFTRNQRYASAIYEQVSQIQRKYKEKERNEYGSMSHKLPILIRSAGLAQALAFVASRGSDSQQELLEHLAQVVISQDANADQLLTRSRTAPLNQYMQLSQSVMAALLWYKRFAQSVLGVEASQDDGTGGN